jgi:hypothetical protein
MTRSRRRPRRNPDDLRVFRDPLLDHREFLRFGAFGPSASRVRLDEEFRSEVLGGKNFEAGLSVYTAYQLGGGRMELEVPNLRAAAYHVKAGEYLQDMLAGFVRAIQRDEVYLVTGRVVSVEHVYFDDGREEQVLAQDALLGSDGEPLLDPSTVRVVRRFEDWSALDKVLVGEARRPIGDVRLWYGRTLRAAVEDFDPDDDAPDEGPRENPRASRRRRKATLRWSLA